MKTYLECWTNVAAALFSQALAGEPELAESLPKPLAEGSFGFAATLAGEREGRQQDGRDDQEVGQLRVVRSEQPETGQVHVVNGRRLVVGRVAVEHRTPLHGLCHDGVRGLVA